jgi:hypothetical protein
MVGVPASPAGLTPDWLTRALVSGGLDVRVTDLDVTPIGVGFGVMSLVFRLTPTYEGPTGPLTLVAKIAPPYEQVRQIAAGYGFYRREVEIYRQLRPRLGMRPPEYFFGAYRAEDDSFVVVIEDLGGLRSHDQLIGCPIEDASLVVEAMAIHHARWWGDTTLLGLGYVQSAAESPWPEFNDQAMRQSWPIVLERFGSLIPERIRALGERWSEIGPVIMRDTVNHPFTLCHGDVRLDNVFFHETGDPVSVIDWQIANVGQGAGDLAYFMSQSLAVDVRHRYQQELLDLYHRTLFAHGITDYGRDELWTDYRRAVLFDFTYPATAGAVELVHDRAWALAKSMLERSIAAIIDTDANDITPSA